MTSMSPRTRSRSRWPSTVYHPRLAVSDDALFTRGSLASSLRRRHTFACVSAFVARDRPVAPNQSAGHGHYGHTRHDRPDLAFQKRPGASLEVSRPLQHTSAASRAISEGGRPPDLSRSGVLRSPSRPRSRATDLTIGERFAPAVFRFISESLRRRSIQWTLWGLVVRSRI